MADQKITKKTVAFAPQSLTSATFDSEKSPYYGESQGDLDQNPVDDLKNTLSSFWTFNPEFFDYPAISFDEEGSISWKRIIEENILQPFLPKNRLILQHIVKGLKQDQQKKFSIFDERKDVKLSPKKSNTYTGSATSLNENHIERILQEIRRRMERKHIVPVKRPLAEKYEARSVSNHKAFIKKKLKLEREKEKDSLVNHQLYSLDLSLSEQNREDFFGLYEPEHEESRREPPKTKKSVEFGPLKIVTHSVIASSTQKIEQPGNSLPKNPKDQLILKKMIRRKSCCCSECGGISVFEKRTVDIFINKEETNDKTALIKSDRGLLQVSESAALVIKDKYGRYSRFGREGGAITPVIKEEKSPLIKNIRNLLEAPGVDRRKSSNTLNIEGLNQPPTRRNSRIHTLVVSNRDTPTIEHRNRHSQTPNQRRTPAGLIMLNIPGRDNFEDGVNAIQERIASGKSKEKLDSQGDVHITKIKKRKNKGVTLTKIKKNKHSKSAKKDQGQVKIYELTRGGTSVTDRSCLSREITQPISARLRQNVKEFIDKNQDLYPSKDHLPSPLTAASPTEASFGLSHRRNFTLPNNQNLSARVKTEDQALPSPRVNLSNKKVAVEEISSSRPSTNQMQSITRIYRNRVQKVPILGLPVNIQQVGSPLFSSPVLTSTHRAQRDPDLMISPFQSNLDLSPYVSPKNSQFRINKAKPHSVSTTQSASRTRTGSQNKEQSKI